MTDLLTERYVAFVTELTPEPDGTRQYIWEVRDAFIEDMPLVIRDRIYNSEWDAEHVSKTVKQALNNAYRMYSLSCTVCGDWPLRAGLIDFTHTRKGINVPAVTLPIGIVTAP